MQNIRKVLVANRGEIALRVMRTARQLGCQTVAVCSEADRSALHVRHADEVVCLGGGHAASENYLNIRAIVDACKRTGANAVHPGYGFLSENAEFAKALDAEGIRFVGPPASAIAAMGDKVESKRLAKAAGVNTIPGFVGVVSTAAEAVAEAKNIGFPVMIKASAGGGGKGMRIAWNEAEVEAGFKMATDEAVSSFGDGRILMEAFVVEPRHIEIQLIGDAHGNTLWLPERECSIQRRNQKVVEEAPSPFIDQATRVAMGEQAVALAKAVNYCSAGTVEFLVDKHRNFYFLEMNTRLQVEHPVTEAITRLDLVEQMLRVADGQALSINQEEASSIFGWAMESRVYAEDPARHFLPSIGRLRQYVEPRGVGVRCDAGVTQGSDISMHYDPMISKLVTHGATRPIALSRMRSALDRYVIRGPEHNVPFLRAVVGHPAFEAGDITTAFIPDHYPAEGDTAPLKLPLDAQQEASMLALIAAWHMRQVLKLDPTALEGNRSTLSLGMGGGEEQVARVGRAPAAMVAASEDGEVAVAVELPGRESLTVELLRPKPGAPYCPDLVLARVNGEEVAMQVVKRSPRGALFQFCGAQRNVTVQSPAGAALQRVMPPPFVIDGTKMVTAPMPGLIVSVDVKVGQELSPGDQVVMLEAMKMRNVLRAENGGKVKAVHAKMGSSVSADEVLVEFE